jgi:hypothetical protein
MLHLGADSSFLAADIPGSPPPSSTTRIFSHSIPSAKGRLLEDLMGRFVHANRSQLSSTHFSQGFVSLDWHSHPLVREADIIQLHWMGEWISPQDIYRLRELGKHVILFLHDCRFFTGGCHFPSACTRFTNGCGECPQLENDRFTDSFHQLLGLACEGLPLVASNRWLLQTAATNPFFSMSTGCVAPDDLPAEVYSPADSTAAKLKLGLPSDHFIMLLGAADPRDERKGIAPFLEELQSGRISFAGSDRPVMLVTIGPPLELGANLLPCKLKQLGFQKTEANLIETYRAADTLVLPSLEDNSPLMALGAMACGTTVIAFEVGGIPELLGESGLTCKANDWPSLFQRIHELADNPELLAAKRKRARKIFLARHASPAQAAACLAFYGNLQKHEIPQVSAAKFLPLLAEWQDKLFVSVGTELITLEETRLALEGAIAWRDGLRIWKQPRAVISRFMTMLGV